MRTKFNDLKVVVGLGKTGMSCIRYLAAQGCNLAVIDSRQKPPELDILKQNFPDIPVFLGSFDHNILCQATELIVSPGVAIQEPAIAVQIDQNKPVIGDIELFVRSTNTPIVAITGTNGKSTVVSLVGAMAKNAGINVKVGGNLGTPSLDLLDNAAELYVLELSSFQLETTYSLKSAAATILNISPDHLDRYPSLAEYLVAKQRIYLGCSAAIVNADDQVCYDHLNLPKTLISFGLNPNLNPDFGLANGFLNYRNDHLLAINELRIKGLHQIANALAALALGSAINLPMAAMLETLRTFSGLPHRCQWVITINGVDWFNDSKGTNVGATKAAIEGLGGSIKKQGKVVLIAGGIGKDADFSPLQTAVAEFVKTVILIGRDAKIIETALHGAAKTIHATSMQDAIELAGAEAAPGDAVLLSPACASFDMFNNFEHRGEVFMQLVKKL